MSKNIDLLNSKRIQRRGNKVTITIVLFIVVNLIIINNENAFALPPHCDRSGYPSCYSVGYDASKESPGKGCPHGHSANFCEGWNAGSSTVINNGIQNVKNDKTSSSLNSTSGQSVTFLFVILFLLVIGVIALKLRNRNKPKERKGFPQYVKEIVLRKQDLKCAHCKKLLNVIDWDHKNGNRSDNKVIVRHYALTVMQ